MKMITGKNSDSETSIASHRIGRYMMMFYKCLGKNQFFSELRSLCLIKWPSKMLHSFTYRYISTYEILKLITPFFIECQVSPNECIPWSMNIAMMLHSSILLVHFIKHKQVISEERPISSLHLLTWNWNWIDELERIKSQFWGWVLSTNLGSHTY